MKQKFNPLSGQFNTSGDGAAVTGQSVDYVNVKLAANTTITANNPVQFTQANATGNIPVSNGLFTLYAGKTYRLTGSVGVATVSNSYCVINWYNNTTSSYFGSVGVGSPIQGNTGNTYAPAEAIITPTTNITVSLRCTQANTATLISDYTYATITQLGTSSVTDMVGATSTTAGVKGTVPAPKAGDQQKFLRADSTWQYTNNTYASLKTIKFTTIMSATLGAQTTIAHGLTASKIMSITGIATAGSGYIPPGHINTSYQYSLSANANNIIIQPASGANALQGVGLTIIVTYEE